MSQLTCPTNAQPGDYVTINIVGDVIRVSKHFTSAGPAKAYRVRADRTLERLFWA